MEYGTLLVFLLFSVVFVGGGIAVNYLIMPQKPGRVPLAAGWLD